MTTSWTALNTAARLLSTTRTRAGRAAHIVVVASHVFFSVAGRVSLFLLFRQLELYSTAPRPQILCLSSSKKS